MAAALVAQMVRRRGQRFLAQHMHHRRPASGRPRREIARLFSVFMLFFVEENQFSH
jgi:hypothetical protein